MARVSNTQITPIIGKGVTKSDALDAAGIALEQWKTDNPNKDLIGVWTREDVETIEEVTSQVYVIFVIASKNDLPD